MRQANIVLLLIFVSIAVHAEKIFAHLAQQHLITQEEHFAAPAAPAKPTTPAKPAATTPNKPAPATNTKKTPANPPSKTAVPAKANTNKLPTQQPAVSKSVAGKPSTSAPAQAKTPKTNTVQSKVGKSSAPAPKVAVQKVNPPQTKTNAKTQTKNAKPAGKVQAKTTQKVNNYKQTASKPVKKVVKNPDNCYHAIDKAGLAKLQAYLPQKLKGKISCKNRLSCFLGQHQLQRYLNAIENDSNCKCVAKTAKKNQVVKCQVKALSGLDLDDNPLHIYYRFSKDGKLNLNEIRSVTVEFKAEERKGKEGKSVVSWGVSAAYPA